MLWLCLHLPRLAVELRQPPDAAAPATGRSPAQERRALRALAAWAQQWSSDVCVDAARWLIALEAGASLKLFGSPESLRRQVLESAAALGYSVRPGIAPTYEGAVLIARSGHDATVTTLHALRAEVARRPLEDLCIPDGILQGLRDAGLASIGEVLQLPASGLARRFGPEFPDYLQRLLGERPDPKRRFRMAQRYRRVVECAYPVENAQALLFPLRRMLQELQGWLRGRDGAVDSLTIILRHRDAPPTALQTRLGAPERDAAVFTPLLRERLERLSLPAPVTHLVLEAGPPVAPSIAQHSLFDTQVTREAQWTQLLDRLRARLGEAAVRELTLLDDHRPERAWSAQCGTPAGNRTAGRQSAAQPEALPPARPLWIMAPRPLRELPRLLGDPERIEAGWWDGTDARRDYYVAETAQGALWWVYRDLSSNTWFLHGIWA